MNPVEILLVEDNEDDIELILHALRSENFGNHIQVARDGEEALQYIESCQSEVTSSSTRTPKLILLDLKLPKFDGLQVLRALKDKSTTQLIPVVLLTSATGDEDIINAYKLGVNSYLPKPVNLEQFRRIVKQLYGLAVNRAHTTSAVQAEEIEARSRP